MADSHFQRLGQPIGIHPTLDAFKTVGVIHSQSLLCIRIFRFIKSTGHLRFQLFPGIQQMIIRQIRCTDSHVQIIRNPQLAFLRSLGCHDHHSVGSPGSVDRRSRSVFQNRYTLDTVHIQVEDFLHIHLISVQNKGWQVRIIFQIGFRQSFSTKSGISPNPEIRHGVRIRPHIHIVFQTERGIKHL